MFLYDEVMHGDEYRYQIDENNPATPKQISEIKSRIRKMHNYIGERIRIEFAPNGGNENPEQTILNFMQFEKERVMKKRTASTWKYRSRAGATKRKNGITARNIARA